MFHDFPGRSSTGECYVMVARSLRLRTGDTGAQFSALTAGVILLSPRDELGSTLHQPFPRAEGKAQLYQLLIAKCYLLITRGVYGNIPFFRSQHQGLRNR